jgi:hypothetical protein
MKRGIIPFVLISLIAIGSLVVVNQRNSTIDNRVFAALPETATPNPTMFTPGPVQEKSMDSPDGMETLTMESQEFEEYVRYTFFRSVEPEIEKQKIFTKDEEPSQNLSIPYNTWSPDNMFVFIKESGSPQDTYYVFFANGEKFLNGSSYLDMQKLFAEQVSGFTITEVTGWAAPNLLLVNTKTDDGEDKVSFWFDVPSQSFIQLGTYFY